jgi:hypothetical protein
MNYRDYVVEDESSRRGRQALLPHSGANLRNPTSLSADLFAFDEPSVEPSENYNISFTFEPSAVYITKRHNDDSAEIFLIVVFSSIASALLIIALLWRKYNKKRRHNAKTMSTSLEYADVEFGTTFVVFTD